MEDMVQATKGIALASSKTVLAGNSCRQADLKAAADLSKNAVKKLLLICKSVAASCPVEENSSK